MEAKESVRIANATLNPADEASVIKKALISLETSRALTNNAIKEMKKSKDLTGKLQEEDKKIESVKSVIWMAGVEANNISSILGNVDPGNADVFHESHSVAASISEQMRTEMRRADDLKADMYKLRQKLSIWSQIGMLNFPWPKKTYLKR